MYHFVTTFRANGYETSAGGKVWINDSAYRLELEPDLTGQRDYDVAVSHDADNTATLINLRTGTIFARQRVPGKIVSSRLFLMPGGLEGVLDGEADVRVSAAPGDVIAGIATKKRTIEVTYHLFTVLDGSVVKAEVRATSVVWSAAALPRLPLRRNLTTGQPKLDAELAQLFDAIPGMILRNDLIVARTVEGGPTLTETVTTRVDTVKSMPLDAKVFDASAILAAQRR